MSTRYVWTKLTTVSGYSLYKAGENTEWMGSHDVLEVGTGYKITNNGKFELTGSKASIASGDSSIAGISVYVRDFRYVLYNENNLFSYAESYLNDDRWHLRQMSVSTSQPYRLTMSTSPDGTSSGYSIALFKIKEGNTESGSFIGYTSSSSSSAYPSDGVSGSYWYEYLGSDNIDPYSLTYTSEAIAGKIISMQISPRAPTHPGTVYYQYQYSINNGSTWANIGNKTTATNISVTIPTTATQFKARVLASDDLGFTSTTYVVGSNLTIQAESSGDNFIGIGGTARQIDKMYIGIGGTAREVTEGYIGVDGTARKFYG